MASLSTWSVPSGLQSWSRSSCVLSLSPGRTLVWSNIKRSGIGETGGEAGEAGEVGEAGEASVLLLLTAEDTAWAKRDGVEGENGLGAAKLLSFSRLNPELPTPRADLFCCSSQTPSTAGGNGGGGSMAGGGGAGRGVIMVGRSST